MSEAVATAPAARAGVDPRWLSSGLLTAILAIGQWRYQILGDSYVPWILALSTAIAAEIVLYRLHARGFPNLLSAYISGNSVAILLKPAAGLLWPFVVCSLLAITSKYVLRWRGRHLWNPTNFSVCAMLALAAGQVGMLSHQWGNDPAVVAVIWGIGLLTVWRARILHVTLAYLGAFALLAVLRAAATGAPLGAELGPVTGPMYQLFMFFMITDPRTQVRGRSRQAAVAVLVALVECAIRLACDADLVPASHPLASAPPMFALFLVGPASLALELARGGGRRA